jgi:ABC-type phosphate transport system auxiliary subunit
MARPENTRTFRRPRLVDRVEALLAAARATGRPIAADELEHVYTAGCAESLETHAELLRVKRRTAAAEVDASERADAASELVRLVRRRRALEQELQRLRAELRHLRTALGWIRLQEAGDVDAPVARLGQAARAGSGQQ